MGKITDIKTQKGNKSRVSVYIDGRFFCGLDALTALKHRLEIGSEADEDELAKIQAESEYASALDKSLGYLSVRQRSEKEISDYLKKKGCLPMTVSRVKERLRELGYLNDREFARAYVAENKRVYGTIRLKTELMKRGVSRDIIDETLEADDRSEEVKEIAKKLWKTCGGEKRKLKEKLYRKGCMSDEIYEALDSLDDEAFFEDNEDSDE